ncbi:hypothetical protein [Acidisoma sp. C75]
MTQTLPAEALKHRATDFPLSALPVADQFVLLAGEALWSARLADIGARIEATRRCGTVVKQRHALERAIERLRGRADGMGATSVAEARLRAILAEAALAVESLSPDGRARLAARVEAALTGDGRLVELLHLFRTAALQRARGFDLRYAGLEDDAPYDLLLTREGSEVECVCHMVQAEAGRDIHRLAWAALCDGVEARLKPWIGERPGRYLLKMNLARGLRDGDAPVLAAIQGRICALLDRGGRICQDEQAVLRIEPLVLGTGTVPSTEGLLAGLRSEFGPEAHLAVTTTGESVWAMAARAGRRNDVSGHMRRDLESLAPARVSGTRPAILALFFEDMDRGEWRVLMDSLELEGAARQYMTMPDAAPVVAVTCYSRMEMFGLSGPDAAAEGELRFRNPAHPAAKIAGLAPAIQSSL